MLGDGVFIGPAVVLTNDTTPARSTPTARSKSAADWEPVGVTSARARRSAPGAVCVAPVTIGGWALVGAGAVVDRRRPRLRPRRRQSRPAASAGSAAPAARCARARPGPGAAPRPAPATVETPTAIDTETDVSSTILRSRRQAAASATRSARPSTACCAAACSPRAPRSRRSRASSPRTSAGGRASRSTRAPRRCTSACSRSASAPATRSSCRRSRFAATANAVALTGAHAGLRRHRARQLLPRPGRRRGRDHRRAPARSCPCTSTATRPTWRRSPTSPTRTASPSSRTPPRPTARRSTARPVGTFGASPMLQLLPHQEHDLRRGRHGRLRRRRGRPRRCACCATRAWSGGTRTRSSASTPG